jgi:hypothetical protein
MIVLSACVSTGNEAKIEKGTETGFQDAGFFSDQERLVQEWQHRPPPVASYFDLALEGDFLAIVKYKGQASRVNIPASIDGIPVGSIGDGAFSYCDSLTSVNIPAGVTSIGEDAFSFCNNLSAIVVDTGNKQYHSVNGIVFSKDGITLVVYPSGRRDSTYTIPAGVTTIGNWAFCWCVSLTSVNIPVGVTSIGDRAFYECDSLTSVSIPAGVASIGDRAFSGCARLSFADREAIRRRFGDRVF